MKKAAIAVAVVITLAANAFGAQQIVNNGETFGVARSKINSNFSELYSHLIDSFADIIALFDGGACSGYLKSDGTCDTPTGSGLVDSVNGQIGTVVLDAGDIGITDTGTYFTGTDVEAALQEIGPTMTNARTPTSHNNTSHSETYITGNQTITLSGDASGSGTTAITVTVADDSHNHTNYLTGNQSITLSGDVTGSGTTAITATIAADSVALGTDTTGNYVSGATANGGLTLTGTEGATLGLLTTCDIGQILKWNGSAWGCSADTGGDLVNDTTPQLGGNLDLNEKSIVMAPAPTDNTAHGVVISDTIAETVAQCDSLFLHSDGKWYQTDSNIEAEVKALQGMATADGTGEHTANVLLNGICKNTTDLAFATIGAVLYAPETVGPPTTTIPADTGDFVRVIGWVINADTIYFNPSPDYLER